MTGRRIARNTLWNLAATMGPMPIAVVSIPVLIRGLGAERFGLLALAWTLIGYFSLFDLGLGRALTKLVAEKLGAGKRAEIPASFWTSLALMAGLGICGSVVLAGLAATPALRLLKVPPGMEGEVRAAAWWMAAAIPLVTLTAGLRGFLEAQQRFDLAGPIRAGTGALVLLGPVLALAWSRELPAMLGAIVSARLLALGAHFAACVQVMPALWRERGVRWRLAAPLARFGGWLTVTNVVSPLMVTMDRFLIGGLLGAGAVAYYATPFEVVTKFLLLPVALVGVLFPAFSASLAGEGRQARRLYRRGLEVLGVGLLPLTVLAVVFAKPGLAWWVGPEMASHSWRVMQILAVGVWINGMAQMPFALLQGAGRPDLTARFHLLELPLYGVALWWGIRWFGVEGAAAAWTLRVAVDAGLLGWWARGWASPRWPNSGLLLAGRALADEP